MLGLRPRLRHTRSLYDIVKEKRHTLDLINDPLNNTNSFIDNNSSIDEELPANTPLPASPLVAPRTTRAHSTPVKPIVLNEAAAPIAKMAPAKTEMEDEMSGGKVFSVSGPVIVAENMIGCAMYELVGYSMAALRSERC